MRIVLSFSSGPVLPPSTHLMLCQARQEAETLTFVTDKSFFVCLTAAAVACTCSHSVLLLVPLYLRNKLRFWIHHFCSNTVSKMSCLIWTHVHHVCEARVRVKLFLLVDSNVWKLSKAKGHSEKRKRSARMLYWKPAGALCTNNDKHDTAFLA